MQEIVVNKESLVKILEENRTKHVETFKVAYSNFLDAARDNLAKKLIHLNSVNSPEDKLPDLYFDLPVPSSHEEQYTRAIGMLQMHQLDTIELSMGEYKQYVEDAWSWKNDFEGVATTYGAS